MREQGIAGPSAQPLPSSPARIVLNETAAVGGMRQPIAMSTQKDSASFETMQSGDVLVSHSTAVIEREISIVPNAPHATSATRDIAVSDACAQADATGVDAWLTEDHRHVVKISSHRRPTN